MIGGKYLAGDRGAFDIEYLSDPQICPNCANPVHEGPCRRKTQEPTVKPATAPLGEIAIGRMEPETIHAFMRWLQNLHE